MAKTNEFEIAKSATGGFEIQTLDDAHRFGKFVIDAGFFPAFNKPTQVVVAIQIAKDNNVPFSLIAQNIAFINNRATLYGDALIGVARASGAMEDFVETVTGDGDDAKATCTVTVKGLKTPIARTFSVKDAKRAKLWGKKGPWTDYPNRMLQMRARSWALRDAGLVQGIVAREEALDIPTDSSPAIREVKVEVEPDGDWTELIGGEPEDEVPDVPPDEDEREEQESWEEGNDSIPF